MSAFDEVGQSPRSLSKEMNLDKQMDIKLDKLMKELTPSCVYPQQICTVCGETLKLVTDSACNECSAVDPNKDKNYYNVFISDSIHSVQSCVMMLKISPS